MRIARRLTKLIFLAMLLIGVGAAYLYYLALIGQAEVGDNLSSLLVISVVFITGPLAMLFTVLRGPPAHAVRPVINDGALPEESRREGSEDDVGNQEEEKGNLYADRWTTTRIECNTKSTATVLGIFSVIWTAIFGGMFIAYLRESGWAISAAFFGLGAATGIGILLLGISITMYLRWKKFGTSILELPLGWGEIGGAVNALLKTAGAVSAAGEYTFTLQCRESITTGTGKNRTTRTTTIWENTKKLRAPGYNSRAGIPIEIAIPPTCLETNDESSSGKVDWELTVHAPVEGIDFHAAFAIPVYKKRCQE